MALPPRRPQADGYNFSLASATGGRLQYRMRFPRTPRRFQFVFAARPLYFVTFCSYRKRPYLATSAVHNALVTFGECAYAEHNIAVGRYVIMPDHIHLFVCGDAEFDLAAWFRLLKPYLSKAVVRRGGEDPVWQRGFFDHVLRSDESYAEKWNYVRENPVRAGFVESADAWPYAGEIISIDRV
jgi:putative transposase